MNLRYGDRLDDEASRQFTTGNALDFGTLPDHIFAIGKEVHCSYPLTQGAAAIQITVTDDNVRQIRDICIAYLDAKAAR